MKKNIYTYSKKGKFFRVAFFALSIFSLTACGSLTRLSEIGQEPALSGIDNPTQKKGYKQVSMPMPTPPKVRPNMNSLWRPGARGFFKDQRASRVGDILTVHVNINDDALLENASEQKRGDDNDSLGVNALGGMENYFNKVLPESVDPTNLVDIESSRENSGEGKIDRKEEINLTLAAVVTQILPNGNLVISGTQEARVNYELRQLQLSGIVRKEDISSRNTIESNQIAELRVAYGGRGTISDVQQARYGRQLLDIIMPF
jgi:flagellar L-ring protein precursor FlgH